MKYELVKPNNNNLENQLKELFGFMLDSNSIQEPTNPQYFVEGWHSGAIKIFTARDNDKLVALKVVLVIKDPLAQLMSIMLWWYISNT